MSFSSVKILSCGSMFLNKVMTLFNEPECDKIRDSGTKLDKLGTNSGSKQIFARYPPDGLLTSGKSKQDVELAPDIIAPDPFASDDYSPERLYLLTKAEEVNTMNTGEDESSSGLNGRLRPRKSHVPSPQTKTIRKIDEKVALDKPKRTNTPSKASTTKIDDLSIKADSPAQQYLCPYCDKKFASKQTVSKHARRVHLSNSKQDALILCLFCNHPEAEANDIIRHMVNSHPNQYFACLECHTRFPSTSELAEHKLNVCEKHKPSYRSKLRQKSSAGSKKSQKKLNIVRKDDFQTDEPDERSFNGIVISCELKPSQMHDDADIEDNITTNLILPPSKNLGTNAVMEKNAVIVLDDIQWNKRIPSNFSFHNTDADQILSRLGVVHRSPRTGESTRKDWKTIDDSTQKFERCFDTVFYSKVASNVQENLAKFLDGSFNFNPDPDNTIKTRKSKNSVIINTAEGFPILLLSEQFSRNVFDGFMPRSIAPKHKWKWDNLENDKSLMNPDQIKRDSHVNNCIITLVSGLDIWTQLSMRRKFEDTFNKSPVAKKTEKKNKISQELKEILESRELPTTSSQVVKHTSLPPPPVQTSDFPACLGLMPAAPSYVQPPAVLSGEWVRPRCYVCCACGAQTRDSRALSTHISSQHQNAQVQHYEIVGELLLNADILKHLYVPPSQMYNRTRPLRGFRDCTKCKKSITLEDLHQHMLDCAGDTPTVRRKCRHRPFGVRRRRPRLPDNTIRKKIRKDIRTRQRQKTHIRSRPKIRTEVGDAETIRKMIADLPAKRHRATVNPMNPILRPRKNLDKKRGKLLTKRRSFDEQSKRKASFTKDKIKSSDITSNPEQTDTQTNIDDDDKPLKPKLKRLKTTRQRETLKRKSILKRAKQRIQTNTQQNMTENSHESDGHIKCADNIPIENVSMGSTSQRIDLSSSAYNTRENANRSGSNNRNDQQPGSSRQNGNAVNPGAAPVQNVPLKHSIARLTANSETHDKSVQFHHLFLVQQECNNVAQHVPSGQLRTFENEAAVIRFDKPPLESPESPVDTAAQQKSKLDQQRKKLDDCITKLRKKVDPTPALEHVSVQCGSDEPLDTEPVLMGSKSFNPMMDITCSDVSKSVSIQDQPIEICNPKETTQGQSIGSFEEIIQDQSIIKHSPKKSIQDQQIEKCSPIKAIEDQPIEKYSPKKPVQDQRVEKCSSKKAIQDQPNEKCNTKKTIPDQPIKKTGSKKANQSSPKMTILDQPIEKSNTKKNQPIKKCSPKKAAQNQSTAKSRSKKTIHDQPIEMHSTDKAPVSLKAYNTPHEKSYSEYGNDINMSHADAMSLKQLMKEVTPKRVSTRLRSTAHLEREIPEKKTCELSHKKLQEFNLASQNTLPTMLPVLPVLNSLEMQRLTQMGYHHPKFHDLIMHQQAIDILRHTQRETSLHKLKQLPIQSFMDSSQQKLMPLPSQIELIPLNYPETHSTQRKDKSTRSRSRRNSYQHSVDVAEWVANMPKMMEVQPQQKRVTPNVDPVSHQQIDIYFQEDLRKSQLNERKSCETVLHRQSISEGSTNSFSESNLLHQEPEIRSECDNNQITSDTPYLNRDFNDSPGDIPPAHASTNIESNMLTPLDLTSKVVPVPCSENLVQQSEPYSFSNYETYETLDLSSKKLETYNERSPVDIVVDLRMNTLQAEVQDSHTAINMSQISHDEMDDVTDLSINACEDDCLPTDLSLKGKIDSIDLFNKNTENETYEVQDLSRYKHQDTEEQSNLLSEIENPTDLSRNEVVDMSIASTSSTDIQEKGLDSIENQDGPADLSKKINKTQNHQNSTSTWQSLEPEITNIEPMTNLDRNIPTPPNYIDTSPEVLQKSLHNSCLKIQQYIPIRITESNVLTTSSGPSETVRDSIVQSPDDVMQSRTILPCQDDNNDLSIVKTTYNTNFSDSSINLQTSMNSPVISQERLPYIFTRQTLNSSISSIPAYTLPNPIMAAPISKYECTTPVYTLANVCITVTKIESSSSATLTNTLLSVPGTTIASTPSVYTLAGTTVAAPINYGAMTNNTRIGQISDNVVQNATGLKNNDANVSIETPKACLISDNDIKKCDVINVDAEINVEQDPETAKKIAMLPKEIVDILGTMPADHRNQLLNVLPQYVSPTTTVSTTRSDTSDSTYTSSMSCLKSLSKSPCKQMLSCKITVEDTEIMSESQNKFSLNASLQNYDEHSHLKQSYIQPSQSTTDKENTHSTNYLLQQPLTPPQQPLPSSQLQISSHPIPNSMQPATTFKEESIYSTDVQKKANEVHNDKLDNDNLLIDPYTGTLTKRPLKAIEFDQNKIIDLTEDEVASPIIEQCSKDNSHMTIIPSNELINYAVVVKTDKTKDKTASLRAVRIKTPSERHKSTSIDNAKNCIDVQSNIDDPGDSEISKTLDGNKSLAIQQAEVSSTQHSSNFTVDSKCRVTTSPINLESRYQNLQKINSQKSPIPVNEIVGNIPLQPHNKEENTSILCPPNNQSISKALNTIANVENAIPDEETPSNHNALSNSSCNSASSPNATYHSFIQSNSQNIVDKPTPHTINTTKDNAKQNLSTQIEQHISKKVTKEANKVDHEEDDSEDDLSLAVLQKQRDQQKQSILSSHDNEYLRKTLVNQTVINDNKDNKKPIDSDKLRHSEILPPYVNENEDLSNKDHNCEQRNSDGNKLNTHNNSMTNGDTELIKKEMVLRHVCVTDVTEQRLGNIKKSEYANIDTKYNIATESTRNKGTREQDKTERDESFEVEKREQISNRHNKNGKYDSVEAPDEQMKLKEKHDLKYDEICTQKETQATIQVKTDTEENNPEKIKNDRINECPRSNSSENTHETSCHHIIAADEKNVKNSVPQESDEDTRECKKSKKKLRSKKPKIAELKQSSFETDLQLCANVEKHVTPLRRSRRGKSMFVDYTVDLEKSLDTKTLNTVKPPLTKKQLIFSKLLLDEENNSDPAVHSAPNKLSESSKNEICTNDPKFDSSTHISDIKPNCESDCDKSKTQKRKSWSPARRKSKKKKSLESSSDVVSEYSNTNNSKSMKNTRKQRKTSETSTENRPSSADHLNNEQGDCKVASEDNSNNLAILDESLQQYETIPENGNPIEKLTMSPGKRKHSLLMTNDDSDDNLKLKKSKLNNKDETPELNTQDDDKNDSEVEVETQKEKTRVNSEMHTACYNMPVAARRTRSKSASTKSSLLFDPYNIELEDMNDKTSKKEKGEETPKETAKSPKLTKTKKKTKKSSNKSSSKLIKSTALSLKKQEIGESSGLQTDSRVRKKSLTDNVSVLSDSDDSSKSDVPLQKYVDEKERKNSDHLDHTDDTDDETIEDIESDESQSDTEYKHDKESRHSSNNVEITVDKHKEADEQLRSEQFMESFGFFSERKPRKSNLLASKKISETFHIIASESDDGYFGVKERTTKKTHQHERKKSTEVDNNSKAQSAPKTPAKRGRKKKSCTTIVTCYCDICKKDFRRTDNFLRHQMTLLHISKLSEVEMKIKTAPVPHEPNYLIAYKQHLDRFKILTDKLAKRNKDKSKPELKITLPSLEDILADVNKTVREQQLSQRGLSRDEALFLDCCELLKESHTDNGKAKSSFMCSGEPALSALDLLEKQINEDKFDTSSDGDLDAITAKNILESEEVRNLENDLISNLKQAGNGGSFGLQLNINYQNDISKLILIPTTEENSSSVRPPEINDGVIETFETTQESSPSKIKKPPDVKEKMYPDPEIDLFEDKFDKIKRKCRSQAAAAKQTQTVIKSTISKKTRRKSEKKKSKKSSKKNHQTQVLTKGALKGFDGIKVSIPTSDINMSAIVPNLDSPTKKRKKNGSKKKREKCSESSSKSNSEPRVKDSSLNKADVYEFMDNEDAELFELRPSTLMERFKSMSNKETPRTAEYDQVAEDADNSSYSGSDGDDFVYMSDDYVCSDDETENSLLSCETGNVKLGNGMKKNPSALKKKDIVEKNAVMGKIFKHNAVRSDKKNVLESKGSPKSKTNLDQLFDSLLEPNNSATNNNVSPKKDDFVVPLNCDQPNSKYKQTSSNIYDDSDKQKYSSKVGHNNSGQTSSKKYEATTKKYDTVDYGPSTSKRSPDHSLSTPKEHTVTSPKKYDSMPSKNCESPSLKTSERSPPKYNDSSFETYEFKEKTSDEGIGTSYDHSAEIFDQSFDETGVARQRARRKCTVGKQNVLAETWSSESEPDGLPPRPNSAESVVLGVSRKKKGRKKEASQSKSSRVNSRQISVKNHDVESRVAIYNRNSSSSGAGCSGVGRSRAGGTMGADRAIVGGEPQASTSSASAGSTASLAHNPGVKPRPRSIAYYNWSSEENDDQEHLQQHGWIVGDSHKKLVTMLAHAKGRKRNNDDKRHLVE